MKVHGIGLCESEEDALEAWSFMLKAAVAEFNSPEFYDRFENNEDLIDLKLEIDALRTAAVYFSDEKERPWICLIYPDVVNQEVKVISPYTTAVRSYSFEDYDSGNFLDDVEEYIAVERKRNMKGKI